MPVSREQITAATDKPIVIAETSTVGTHGIDKAGWFLAAWRAMTYQFPRVQQKRTVASTITLLAGASVACLPCSRSAKYSCTRLCNLVCMFMFLWTYV
eukprot:16619-Heterococcus_DN1.PRE.7